MIHFLGKKQISIIIKLSLQFEHWLDLTGQRRVDVSVRLRKSGRQSDEKGNPDLWVFIIFGQINPIISYVLT